MSCKKREANELKLDIEELSLLLHQAKRKKTKDLLSIEMCKLETELSNLKKSIQEQDVESIQESKSQTVRCYDVKLTNYCWDETEKFMRLYVTLSGVHKLPNEAVKCQFDSRAMNLMVPELEGKNYRLDISNLCDEIVPEKCHTKVKTDMIVVSLAKKVQKLWSHVTRVEKQIQQSKVQSKPDMTDSSDPESSLMNLMKKMYQDGDDDLKRTIAKAWTESQEKRTADL